MSYIAIKVGDYWIKMMQGASYKLIIKTPLFIYDAQPASRIAPFTISAKANEILFKNSNRVDKRNRQKSYECEIYLGGVFYKKAKLDLLKSSEDFYECQVRFDKSYYGDIANRSLRTFEYKKDHTGWRFWYKNCEHFLFYFDPIVVPNPSYVFTIGLPYNGTTYTYNIPYIDGLDNDLSKFPDARVNFFQRIIDTINTDHDKHKFFAEALDFQKLVIGFAGGYVNQYMTHSGSSVDITYLYETYLYNSGTYHPLETIDDVFEEVQANPTKYDHCFFPIINRNYFGRDITEMNLSVFFYTNDEIKYMNAQFPPHFVAPHPFVKQYLTSVTPFVYLYDVIRMINEEIGATIEDSFFDEELKKLIVYNTTDASENFKKTAAATWMFTARKFKVSDSVPNMPLSNFYNALGVQFCTVFDYDSNRNNLSIVPRKKVLSNADYEDWSSKINYGMVYDTLAFKPDLKYEFDANDSIPSEKLKEPVDTILKAEQNNILDLLGLPKASNEIGDSRLVKAANHIYSVLKIFGAGSPDIWSFFSENMYNFKYDSEQSDGDELTTVSNTVFQELDVLGKEHNDATPDDYYHLIIPIANQIGRSMRENSLQEEHGLRLLFYRGMKTIMQGTSVPGYVFTYSAETYAWGTYNNIFIDGSIDGNYTLNWNGDSGLYSTHWKDWLDFLANTSECIYDFTPSLIDILNFKGLQKKRINNLDYLIDEIEVMISDKIDSAKMKCYPKKTSFHD